MFWKLIHENVEVDENNRINSRSSIVFTHNDTSIKIGDTVTTESHVLGSKKVLMDTAYKFEDMARQMKKKAESML